MNQGLQCKHYGFKEYSIEKYYKLIGYHKDFKPKTEFKKSSMSSPVVASHVSVIPCSSSSSSDNLDQPYLISE